MALTSLPEIAHMTPLDRVKKALESAGHESHHLVEVVAGDMVSLTDSISDEKHTTVSRALGKGARSFPVESKVHQLANQVRETIALVPEPAQAPPA